MSRIASVFLILSLITLSACSDLSEVGTLRQPGETQEAPTDTTQDPPQEPTAADGDDTDACLSGSCEIEVTDTVVIDFGGDFDISTLTLSYSAEVLTIETEFDGGGTGSGSITRAGTVMMNNLVIQLIDYGETTGIVALQLL